ncbi:shikimate kinase [Ruminiclostridium sufflavum DSM 19573]|uniref:Shikimate kinase n=1 Tax=Ruminiclostridium sufflavum DSM 19573 TaxID=1121337 RepID=A0A318XJZ6_9FIRM|nr:shikimate kinase [Ruminiclostridium sufflavum]PYG86673.1 shikimate kinase [Ruminiclostridium sufflavum DSM 19573]
MTQGSDKSNIVLIGMPGCGKTTTGKLLAALLDYTFIDCDQLIADKTGKSPRQVVEESGRDFFLNVQEEAVLSIKQTNCIIATGGGIVHSDTAMKYLKTIGFVLFLDAKYDIIEERMDASRKLVRTNGSLLELYNERKPLYCKYADAIIDCDSADSQLLCNRILKEIDNI